MVFSYSKSNWYKSIYSIIISGGGCCSIIISGGCSITSIMDDSIMDCSNMDYYISTVWSVSTTILNQINCISDSIYNPFYYIDYHCSSTE